MVNEVKIECYAVLKDEIGEFIIYCGNGSMNSDQLIEDLITKYPDKKNILRASRIANGEKILDKTDIIDFNKPIDLLPPASGG